MKTLAALLLFSFSLTLFSQENDDIRIFQSSNHQSENSIAIDPTDPNNILVSAIGRPDGSGGVHVCYFYSHDGGITWGGSEDRPNGVPTKGDPVVAYNSFGDAFLVIKGNPGIKLFKSTDKGHTWGTAITLSSSSTTDKPHLAVGKSTTNNQHVYTAYEEDDGTNYKIFFRRSTNRGSTFSSIILYSHSQEQGKSPNVAAGVNGYVYVSIVHLNLGGTQDKIKLYRSTDGGQNFSWMNNDFDLLDMGLTGASQPYFNGIRINAFPSMGLDNNNVLYMAYTDGDITTGNVYVYLRKSTNNGVNWGSPILVHSGAGSRQWFPSLAVDPINGTIYVSYYNMEGPGFLSYRYIAKSTNGGANFTSIKISDVGFTPQPLGTGYASSYMGDYYETAAYNGIAYPCWSDNRSGVFQAYISPVGGAEVNLDQKLSNDITTVDKVDYWSGSLFKELEIPKTYHFRPVINQVLRGEQEILSNEKYNKWNITDEVENHHVFIFQPGNENLISQFEPTYSGITIKNEFLEAQGINPDDDEIDFKDPWYIDIKDAAYGNEERNRGMEEVVWRIRQSNPFYPDYNTVFQNGIDPSQSYKGVFLNQDYNDPGVPFYSVRSQIQDIYLSQTQGTHKFYFRSWGYDPSKISVQYQGLAETPVVFKTSDAVITANLKGTQLSDNDNAISNNSQRKFVKSLDGYLHSVYESLGTIWYERSSDNGATWQIMNSGLPLETTWEPKLPSIDFLPVSNYQCILIVYQRKRSFGSELVVSVFDNGIRRYVYIVDSFESQFDGFNVTPVVSISQDSKVLIVWKRPTVLPKIVSPESGSPGLDFSYYYLTKDLYGTSYSLNPYSQNQKIHIPNTNSGSVNPTIAQAKTSNVKTFHIAYDNNSSVYYWNCTYNDGAPGSLTYGNPSNISSGDGYTQRSRPSIIAFGTGARLCWVGHRTNEDRVVFTDPDPTVRFWNFGFFVSSPTINKTNNNNYYAFAWSSQGISNWFADNSLSTIRALNTTGKYLQLCNGPSKDTMFVNAFDINTGSINYFKLSNRLGSFYPPSKINTLTLYSGREGNVFIDSVVMLQLEMEFPKFV